MQVAALWDEQATLLERLGKLDRDNAILADKLQQSSGYRSSTGTAFKCKLASLRQS